MKRVAYGEFYKSQFLIGKVEHFKQIDFGNGYQSNLVSQFLRGKVEQDESGEYLEELRRIVSQFLIGKV